eukprot:COSAG03_NODE_4986_length_1371_cov_3.749214_2_plen_100_part_00
MLHTQRESESREKEGRRDRESQSQEKRREGGKEGGRKGEGERERERERERPEDVQAQRPVSVQAVGRRAPPPWPARERELAPEIPSVAVHSALLSPLLL